MKTCSKCKTKKEITEFWKNSKNKDGLHSYCKDCDRKLARIRTKIRYQNPEYKEGRKEYMRIKRLDPIYCEEQREGVRERRKKYRLKALNHYGGSPPKCACCGEAQYEFLAIDHKNNNGAEHRKEIGSTIYEWLRRNNYPEGFQVLCHNCNLADGFYGRCPHKKLTDV